MTYATAEYPELVNLIAFNINLRDFVILKPQFWAIKFYYERNSSVYYYNTCISYFKSLLRITIADIKTLYYVIVWIEHSYVDKLSKYNPLL